MKWEYPVSFLAVIGPDSFMSDKWEGCDMTLPEIRNAEHS